MPGAQSRFINMDQVCEDLHAAGIRTIVALPDSMLGPLCRRLSLDTRLTYIQTTHEAACVGIAAGLTLAGIKSIVIMENSGLRSACETLARFHLSHHLFACYLISHRGAFGEPNWWGQAHHETMEPLLRLLRFRWAAVNSVQQFRTVLDEAFATLASGQASVAMIATPAFTRSLL